jgi:hypothetical protein
MTRTGVFLLALTLLGAGTTATGTAWAAKAKAGKGGKGASPPAEELSKLKAIRLGDPKAGIFGWGMSPTEVQTKVQGAIEQKYKERFDAAKADPGRQHRIREEQVREIDAVKKSFTKFEGQKTGWDVSIIGPEFMQNNGEAVIQTKEDIWTRYFFFFEDRLYKMFLAFNKDVIGGKSFQDFGKEMAGKYGRPRDVYRDEKLRGGVKRTLDHYEWAVSGGDALKLVDRSEFYGVFCLVLSDASVNERVADKRKITNPGHQEKDALVEAALSGKEGADANDNIIDRITGKEVKKPGDEEKKGNVQVPMPKAPSPSEVNTGSGSGSSSSSSASAEKPSKKSKKEDEKEKKGAGSGLEL